MERLCSIDELEKWRNVLVSQRQVTRSCLTVCCGTGCSACGAVTLCKALEEAIKSQNLEQKVDIKTTGCHGFCEQGPLVVIYPEKVFYCRVKPEDAHEIVTETIVKGNIIERLLYTDPSTGQKVIHEDEVPFYNKQMRLLLGNNGVINPESIEDYIAVGGYSALAKVLRNMSPEEVIAEIKRSGLRGRGGAGFPTGRKWESCRKAEGRLKYVICNADEGDPGAFMDRSLLEGNPHSILEGMIIGAYAIGATEGYIYVRNEYPLAIKNVTTAIQQAEKSNLLGENILGTGFSLKIHVNRGGGAFVCGESSALVASIEGKVGEPRAKYVHLAEKGLWGRPTNLNNVKTWASVPLIINKGAEWYSSIGTEKSKGTMIFSLVGKIKNTGLVEVPMGISLRELIYGIGGGIPGDKAFKAVQTGGPSGGCIPQHLIDLPIDYERLTEVGSMMGSGGMIVMDEDTCMVNVAKYFLNFTKDESCGKCVPCREGIKRMLEILTDITEGKGREGDIELLKELSEVVIDASLCQLGKTAPNPVLTTIKYFRDEYEAHIKDKRCPARVCKALIQYRIDEQKCSGCGLCLKNCPAGAITGERKEVHKIDPARCIRCGICYELCKFDAVIIE